MGARWIKYDYTGQLSGLNVVQYRPVIEVEVGYKGSSMYHLAIVDSGSDRTLINADVARALRIDLDSFEKIKVGGIGEKIGYVCDMDITIHDFNVTFSTPIIFVEDLSFGMLLGQKDFFANFHVRFEKNTNVFYLAKAPPIKES